MYGSLNLGLTQPKLCTCDNMSGPVLTSISPLDSRMQYILVFGIAFGGYCAICPHRTLVNGEELGTRGGSTLAIREKHYRSFKLLKTRLHIYVNLQTYIPRRKFPAASARRTQWTARGDRDNIRCHSRWQSTPHVVCLCSAPSLSGVVRETAPNHV